MPDTEAGRALLDGLADALGTTSDSAMGTHGEQFRERIHDAVARGVPAIEQEARSRALAEVRARVEGMPDRSGLGGADTSRAAVLAAIDEVSRG